LEEHPAEPSATRHGGPKTSSPLRVIIVAYLGIKAVVDVSAGLIILNDGEHGSIFGQKTSGSSATGAGDIGFGIFYIVLAVAILRRWRWMAIVAIPVLVVDLLVSNNWGAPLVLLVVLLLPYSRARLWS
jgi:hypothetical protein